MFGKTSMKPDAVNVAERTDTALSRRTICANDLTPGATFEVRGILSYSKLRSPIRGKQLTRHNNYRLKCGGIPIERPHTTATIHDAFVVYSPEGEIPLEERYAEESLYRSLKEGARGMSYTAFNKGYVLPGILQRDPYSDEVSEVMPEGELAAGLDVTLVMRVFKAAKGNGVSLDEVIVNEPIRYYSAGKRDKSHCYDPIFDKGW